MKPGPRICGGMEAAPPGSEQLRRLRDLIGLIFLPYQPDSRDCILFNARKFHLNYDWHCESLMRECSESEPLTKEAGFWTFFWPQEPAESLGACKNMFSQSAWVMREYVELSRGSERERVSNIEAEMCLAAHACCQLFFVLLWCVLSEFCEHNTVPIRSVKNSINLPK